MTNGLINENNNRGHDMDSAKEDEATVEFIVISGSTETDEEIEALTDIIRHSLRTQFPCRKVHVSIEERLSTPETMNGAGYY
jgi:hypothetical protein